MVKLKTNDRFFKIEYLMPHSQKSSPKLFKQFIHKNHPSLTLSKNTHFGFPETCFCCQNDCFQIDQRHFCGARLSTKHASFHLQRRPMSHLREIPIQTRSQLSSIHRAKYGYVNGVME
jgi:hypothetical protein